MKQVNPYLTFPGQTEEAFAFYRSVFGGDFMGIVRYRDMGMADDDSGDLIANIALPLGDDTVLMGSDVPPSRADDLVVGTNVEIHLAANDADEARRLFAALADGGSVSMPMERVAWAELFGSCTDRYGIRWMVDYTGEVRFGG
jgi:PhnB protein